MKQNIGMDWDDFEKELFKRPGFKEAQAETRLEYEIARALIKARIEKGLSKVEVERLMNTKRI